MHQEVVERYRAAGHLFKALSSPVRLAIVDLLAVRPRAVHELVELTGLTQPLVSQHLGVLRGAGVVRSERKQREMAYALRDEHVVRVVREALAHTLAHTVAHGADQPALTVTTGSAVSLSSSSTGVDQPLR